MLINPNRVDIEGRKISTNYEDINGQKFRDKFMEDIRQNGESYLKYSYKKPNTTNMQYKVSYFTIF